MQSSRVSKVTAVFVVATFASVIGAAQRVGVAQEHKPITVVRVYTGADNESHAEQVSIKTTLVTGPQQRWLESGERINATNLQFRRLYPGYFNDWHPAAGHAYIITVSGRGEVEIANGKKIPLDAAHIVQFDDVTGKGHLTRTVGTEDWVQFVVSTN